MFRVLLEDVIRSPQCALVLLSLNELRDRLGIHLGHGGAFCPKKLNQWWGRNLHSANMVILRKYYDGTTMVLRSIQSEEPESPRATPVRTLEDRVSPYCPPAVWQQQGLCVYAGACGSEEVREHVTKIPGEK